MYLNLNKKELDKYIYRIISLERLLELFATENNTLAKPARWEDKFENFILKSKVRLISGEIIQYDIHNRIYGQCWTSQQASDAMWRIYSPNKDGVRIRTTIRKLLKSHYDACPAIPEARCCIGKVLYVSDKKLMQHANNTFDDSGIKVENIFRSLLLKRRAFRHESEVRLLFDEWNEESLKNDIYSYKVSPHDLISQIMIDPRRTYSEYEVIRTIIRNLTGYKGEIKRSLLYSLPKDLIVDVTDDSFE